MIDRRRAVHIALIALSGALLAPSLAHADEAVERFYPLFIDLDGWEGKKPDGMAMAMLGHSMTTATRSYEHSPAHLIVSVVIGPAAVGALTAVKAGINVDTAAGHVISGPINGMPASRTYKTAQKAGTIIIGLSDSAVLNFTYSGLSEDDAMALAQKFDWKAIQAAALTK
jgi:hypothetical protein